MSIPSKTPPVRFAAYNILDPFLAVKHATLVGLTTLGLRTIPSQLSAACVGVPDDPYAHPLPWKQYSNFERDRLPLIAASIQMADVVCVQEVCAATALLISNAVKRTHHLAALATHGKSSQSQHGNAIFVAHGDRFKVHKDSCGAGLAGLTHWNNARTSMRKAAAVTMDIDGRQWAIVSVHLSGYWPDEPDGATKLIAKQRGVSELRNYLEQIEAGALGPIKNVMVAGDFNEGFEEAASTGSYRPKIMADAGYWRCTENSHITEPSTGRKLDWLFFRTETKPASCVSARLETKQIRAASDHLITGVSLGFV